MRNFFAYLGRMVLDFFGHMGGIALLFFSTLYWVFQPSRNQKIIFNQMSFVGIGSLLIIGTTAILIGMVTCWQTGLSVEPFGAKMYIGGVLAVALTREMGPLIVGLLCAGRVGSSITAEIGSMKISEQVDALESLAVEPVQYLVVPRFLACLVMLPILVIFTDIIGLFGGWLVATNNLGVDSAIYINSVLNYATLKDVYFGLIKASVYGIIVALVSCYRGLTVSGGAEDVARATTFAVVYSSLLILVANYLLSVFLHVIA